MNARVQKRRGPRGVANQISPRRENFAGEDFPAECRGKELVRFSRRKSRRQSKNIFVRMRGQAAICPGGRLAPCGLCRHFLSDRSHVLENYFSLHRLGPAYRNRAAGLGRGGGSALDPARSRSGSRRCLEPAATPDRFSSNSLARSEPSRSCGRRRRTRRLDGPRGGEGLA